MTELNRLGVFSGMGAEGITPDQHEELVQHSFDPTPFDACYSSPARRCLDTAEALRVVDPVQDARLREREFGVFDGLSVAECERLYPEELRQFRRLDSAFAIPEGESRAQHLARVLDWLDTASQWGRVLAFTHGGTIDFLYRLGSDIPPHGGTTVYAGPNAARSVFEVELPRIEVVEHGVSLV